MAHKKSIQLSLSQANSPTVYKANSPMIST
uniref:Uncharacterized protein n=1 Tax=Rhizophora mucronata TaxID=61149 RepID=A0A2P2NQC3_RHIMU